MLRKAIVVVSVCLSLAACGGSNDKAPERPPAPQKITAKTIDPPTFKTKKVCVKKFKNGECAKRENQQVVDDDLDWILITEDGEEHDVSKNEYDSVNVGDLWPPS